MICQLAICFSYNFSLEYLCRIDKFRRKAPGILPNGNLQRPLAVSLPLVPRYSRRKHTLPWPMVCGGSLYHIPVVNFIFGFWVSGISAHTQESDTFFDLPLQFREK